jgi:hypothetical protein
MNPEGVVISQAGVERSKTPAIVAILYMNPERVTEQICERRFCRTFGTLYQGLRASHSTPCLCSVTPSGFIIVMHPIAGVSLTSFASPPACILSPH